MAFLELRGGGWRIEKSICGKLYDPSFIYDHILPEHVNVHPQTKYFLQPFVWNKCFKRNLLDESHILFDEERKTWEDNIFLVSCLAETGNLLLSEKIFVRRGDSGAGDHLSGIYNPNLLFGYIKSYEEYTQKFGDRYNFDNVYTNTRYFTITCDILRKLQKNMEQEVYNDLLDTVMNNHYVVFWVRKAKVKKLNTVFVKLAFALKNKMLLKQILVERDGIFVKLKMRLSGVKRRILKIISK